MDNETECEKCKGSYVIFVQRVGRLSFDPEICPCALSLSSYQIAEELKQRGDALEAYPALLKACEDFVSKVKDYQDGKINLRLDDFCFRAKEAIRKARRVK